MIHNKQLVLFVDMLIFKFGLLLLIIFFLQNPSNNYNY